MASKKQSEGESAYSDVSGAVEQSQKDAEAPVEYDDDGNVKPQSSEATAEVYDEMSKRAAGSVEGGGPWPPEVAAERNSGAARLRAHRPEYTSHEEE